MLTNVTSEGPRPVRRPSRSPYGRGPDSRDDVPVGPQSGRAGRFSFSATPGSAGGWWLVSLATVSLTVVGWIWGSRASTLMNSHPAYPAVVSLVGFVGVLLAATGVRRLLGRGRQRFRFGARLRALSRAVQLLVLVLVVGVLAWLRPFPASGTAQQAMDTGPRVAVKTSRTSITLAPRERPTTSGLVFYPGARVDSRAYVPLLRRISARGTLVVVVKAPLYIAFLDGNAASEVIERHPRVRHWVVGGHSLGGVAASFHAGDHPDRVDGLLLWASFPANDLAGTGLSVTSIFGTADGLATPDEIAASRAELPPDARFVAVPGGVHAYFGDYGRQPGDGTPGISRARAQRRVVAASLALTHRVETGR